MGPGKPPPNFSLQISRFECSSRVFLWLSLSRSQMTIRVFHYAVRVRFKGFFSTFFIVFETVPYSKVLHFI